VNDGEHTATRVVHLRASYLSHPVPVVADLAFGPISIRGVGQHTLSAMFIPRDRTPGYLNSPQLLGDRDVVPGAPSTDGCHVSYPTSDVRSHIERAT
jgi:hypothetical protein